MIEKGANNFSDALEGACCGGQREIIDDLIRRGTNNWGCGLRGAILGKFFRKNDDKKKFKNTSRNTLEYDIKNLNQIAFEMIDRGASVNNGFKTAVCMEDLDLANYLLLKGARWNDNVSFYGCHDCDPEIIKLLIKSGAVICDKCDQIWYDHLPKNIDDNSDDNPIDPTQNYNKAI